MTPKHLYILFAIYFGESFTNDFKIVNSLVFKGFIEQDEKSLEFRVTSHGKAVIADICK